MTKPEEPLVSILMNCFNGEKYLNEALESIMAQTYQNWELIFWDNQSTDQSANIFKSYKDPRLKYFLSPEHTDLGGGRAKAFQHLTCVFADLLRVIAICRNKRKHLTTLGSHFIDPNVR